MNVAVTNLVFASSDGNDETACVTFFRYGHACSSSRSADVSSLDPKLNPSDALLKHSAFRSDSILHHLTTLCPDMTNFKIRIQNHKIGIESRFNPTLLV